MFVTIAITYLSVDGFDDDDGAWLILNMGIQGREGCAIVSRVEQELGLVDRVTRWQPVPYCCQLKHHREKVPQLILGKRPQSFQVNSSRV